MADSVFDALKSTEQSNLYKMQANKLAFDMEKEMPEDDSMEEVFINNAKAIGPNARHGKLVLQQFFLGLASGMKGAKNAEKRERMLKNAEVAGFLTQENDKINGLMKQEQEKAFKKAKISPLADNLYLLRSSNAPADQKKKIARESFQLGVDEGFIPKGSTFLSYDEEPMTTTYLKPDGQHGFFSISGYVSKDAMDKRKLELEEQGVQARTMSAEASKLRAENEVEMLPYNKDAKNAYVQHTNFDTNPKLRGDRAAHEEQGRNNAKYISEIQPKLEAADTLYSNLDEIEKIITDSSQTGSSPKDAAWRFLAKKFGFDGTYSEDRMRMLLRSQFSKLPDVLGPGVKSDTDIKMFVEGMIGLDKNKKAVLEQIKFDKALTQNKSNLYRQQAKQYEQDKVANIHTSTANLTTPNSITDQKGTAGAGVEKGSGTTSYKTPDGKIWQLTPEQYNQVPANIRGNLIMAQ